MGIFRKAKKFLEDVDETIGKADAARHRLSDDDEDLADEREEVRKELEELRQDEEDDSSLASALNIPNPVRNWEKQKRQRFLDNTNTPGVKTEEEWREFKRETEEKYSPPIKTKMEPAFVPQQTKRAYNDVKPSIVDYYSKESLWLKLIDSETVRIGITPHAIKDLLEIVFFELPNVHDKLTRSKPFGTIEGVAGILELIAPLSGTVLKINEELISKPELVNEDPYIVGWILLMKPSNLNKEAKFLQDSTN